LAASGFLALSAAALWADEPAEAVGPPWREVARAQQGRIHEIHLTSHYLIWLETEPVENDIPAKPAAWLYRIRLPNGAVELVWTGENRLMVSPPYPRLLVADDGAVAIQSGAAAWALCRPGRPEPVRPADVLGIQQAEPVALAAGQMLAQAPRKDGKRGLCVVPYASRTNLSAQVIWLPPDAGWSPDERQPPPFDGQRALLWGGARDGVKLLLWQRNARDLQEIGRWPALDAFHHMLRPVGVSRDRAVWTYGSSEYHFGARFVRTGESRSALRGDPQPQWRAPRLFWLAAPNPWGVGTDLQAPLLETNLVTGRTVLYDLRIPPGRYPGGQWFGSWNMVSLSPTADRVAHTNTQTIWTAPLPTFRVGPPPDYSPRHDVPPERRVSQWAWRTAAEYERLGLLPVEGRPVLAVHPEIGTYEGAIRLGLAALGSREAAQSMRRLADAWEGIPSGLSARERAYWPSAFERVWADEHPGASGP
jgi:hypothetical protein